MSSHPFSSISKQIMEKELTPSAYVDKQFDNFFEQFSSFLVQFTKPLKKGIFKKNPSKILYTGLDAALEIIKVSSKINYKTEMISDITECFTMILHPLNNNEIRTNGIKMIYVLVNILGNEALNYIYNIRNIIFDYSVLSTICSKESKLTHNIDPVKRLQVSEIQASDINNLYGHIQYIFDEVNNGPDTNFVVWWNIISMLIFKIVYHSTAKKLDLPDSDFGIVGKIPEELHSIIRDFVKNVLLANQRITLIINDTTTINFLIAILNETSNSISISTDQSNFSFVLAFLGLISDPNDKIRKSIYDTNKEFIFSILNSQIILFKSLYNSGVPEKTRYLSNEQFKSLIPALYTMMTLDEQIRMFSQLTSPLSGLNSQSYANLMMQVLTTAISIGISTKEIWEVIANPSDTQQSLTAAAFFAYMVVNLGMAFLGFDEDSLNKAVEDSDDIGNWLNNHGTWLSEGLSDVHQLWSEKASSLCSPELISHIKSASIHFPELPVKNWRHDKAITFLQIIKQSYANNFTVLYSIARPLVVLTSALPWKLGFDRAFIFKEFLDILVFATRRGQAEENVVTALTLLADMLTLRECGPAVSDKMVAEVYNAIRMWAEGTSEKASLAAVNAASRIVSMNLKYSDVLSNIIIEKFTPSHGLSNGVIATDIITLSCYQRDIPNERLITFLSCLKPPTKMECIIEILIEDCVDERSDYVDILLEQSMDIIKYRNSMDIIALSNINLIFPYIEKVSPGSIKKIADSLVSILEVRGTENPTAYMKFAELLVDILIYAPSELNLQSVVGRFAEVVKKATEDGEITQYLQTQFLLLSMYYKYYPMTTFERSPKINGVPFFFRDSVLEISSEGITSNTAVGRFTWSIKEKMPLQIVLNSYDRQEIRPTINDSIEKEISKTLSNFNHDSFTMIDTPESLDLPFKPFDVSKESEIPMAPKQEEIKDVHRNAASFISALGFYDVGSDENLIPCSDETQLSRLDISTFRSTIKVSAVSAPGDHPQFEELMSSLGLKNQESNKVIYTDIRREIIFSTDQEKYDPIVLIWDEDLPLSLLNKSYVKDVFVRIVVTPLNNGLIRVESNSQKVVEKSGEHLQIFTCSKAALPIHVLATIRNAYMTIKGGYGRIFDPLSVTAAELRDLKSDAFQAFPAPFLSTRNLLEVC